MVYLEAEVIRVRCREHGVVVAHVPWARAAARHTHAFEDTVAWWTARASTSVVAELRERAPQAVLCLDPFHVVQWATDAVDSVRRGLWNTLRGQGHAEAASDIRGTRWAVLKNPENLTGGQRTTLATIAKTNSRLYRAYLLKEQLRAVLTARGTPGRALLAGWLAWATRSRIPEFTKLAKSIKHYLPLIRNTLDHGLSNARSESTNTHPRVLTRRSYGFHTPQALITMAMLTRSGLCPPLPGRSTKD